MICGGIEQTSGEIMDNLIGVNEINIHNNYLIQHNDDTEFEYSVFNWKEFPPYDDNFQDITNHKVELSKEIKPKLNTRNNINGKKRKKSKNEVKILETYFAIDPEWSRQTVQKLKPLLKLTVDQIYKWGYDRKHLVEKRKMNIARKKRVLKSKGKQFQEENENLCKEDWDFYLAENDERSMLFEIESEQILFNSLNFNSNFTIQDQSISLNNEMNMKESKFQLRQNNDSEIGLDGKDGKVSYEIISVAADKYSSISITNTFNHDETDFLI